MINPIQYKKYIEMVGRPRTPLPELSDGQRTMARKLLEDLHEPFTPEMGLRISLCSGEEVRSEWLDASVIDTALTLDDIVWNIHRLTKRRQVLHGAEVLEALLKRIDEAPKTVFRVLHKFVKSKAKPRKGTFEPVLDQPTASLLLKTLILLVPLLLRGRLTGPTKRMPRDMFQIAHSVIKSHPGPAAAVLGLDFLRILEKYVGWSALEKDSLAHMQIDILNYPARIVPELLRSGRLTEATLLSERVCLFQAAEEAFRLAVQQVLASNQLPLASKNWAAQVFESMEPNAALGPESEQIASEADYERLALLLISVWEARNEGVNSGHAFVLSEQLLRNGFNIYLSGEVGSIVTFDPDLHEGNRHLERGVPVHLIRPIVEVRTERAIRILIKGRVAPIPS